MMATGSRPEPGCSGPEPAGPNEAKKGDLPENISLPHTEILLIEGMGAL